MGFETILSYLKNLKVNFPFGAGHFAKDRLAELNVLPAVVLPNEKKNRQKTKYVGEFRSKNIWKIICVSFKLFSTMTSFQKKIESFLLVFAFFSTWRVFLKKRVGVL